MFVTRIGEAAFQCGVLIRCAVEFGPVQCAILVELFLLRFHVELNCMHAALCPGKLALDVTAFFGHGGEFFTQTIGFFASGLYFGTASCRETLVACKKRAVGVQGFFQYCGRGS